MIYIYLIRTILIILEDFIIHPVCSKKIFGLKIFMINLIIFGNTFISMILHLKRISNMRVHVCVLVIKIFFNEISNNNSAPFTDFMLEVITVLLLRMKFIFILIYLRYIQIET